MKNLRDQIQSAVDIFKSGDYSKAEKVSKKLVNENPKVAFLYNLLGLILSAQRKREEAIKSLQKKKAKYEELKKEFEGEK